MLEANKSKWFEKVFRIYNRNLISRRFHSFRVDGLENLENKPNDFPLISIANHSSWWDGLILFEIFSHFDFANFVLMEEKQLRNLSLFRKLGAFSIVRENPREALVSLNYAAQVLKKDPKANLWVFPQGEILPNDRRPIKFFNGISRIIRKCGPCFVVPISIRLEFLGEFKPEAFVKIGQIRFFEQIKKSECKTLTNSLAKEMSDLLEGLKENIIKSELESYKNLI